MLGSKDITQLLRWFLSAKKPSKQQCINANKESSSYPYWVAKSIILLSDIFVTFFMTAPTVLRLQCPDGQFKIINPAPNNSAIEQTFTYEMCSHPLSGRNLNVSFIGLPPYIIQEGNKIGGADLDVSFSRGCHELMSWQDRVKISFGTVFDA